MSKALRDVAEARDRNKNLSERNRGLEKEVEKLRGMLSGLEDSMRDARRSPSVRRPALRENSGVFPVFWAHCCGRRTLVRHPVLGAKFRRFSILHFNGPG